MNIIYKCRHCEQNIGTLRTDEVSFDQLGWERLTVEERTEMIQTSANGDVEIRVICENCETTLKENPNYHELDFFIQ